MCWRTSSETKMEEAFVEAQKGLNAKEVPIGCVVMRDGSVVGRGYNQPMGTRNATRHAEVVAIEHLNDVSDCTLYVTVEPCIMCAAYLRLRGLTKVFYGCSNERFGGCGSIMDAHIDPHVTGPALEATLYEEGAVAERAIQLLKAFYDMENERAPEDKRKVKH